MVIPNLLSGGVIGCRHEGTSNMGTRRAGSGLANTTTAAIESMLAAILCGDKNELDVQRKLLTLERAAGRCGMDPAVVEELLSSAVRQLGFKVKQAMPQPPDRLGDVRALLRDGTTRWFEVKAQTKKDSFSAITQADWVRDETDFLRWLNHHDPDFSHQLPLSLRQLVTVPDPIGYFDGWDRDTLWLADMALVSSRSAREQADIRDVKALREMLERKYVVHLTRQGVKVIPMTSIAPIAGILRDDPVDIGYRSGNITSACIMLSSPGPAGHGFTQFTYHFGYPAGTIGRHKMHSVSLTDCAGTIEVDA